MNYNPMKTNYITSGPITQKMIGMLLNKIGSVTDAGGHSLFLGQVRADKMDGKRVVAIEYSAYDEMVKKEAEKIKDQILSEFPDAKSIDIIHSTGIVRAGEISLAVVVSSGHRRQAIDACSKAVELIKEKFPVWKKEIFEDNSYGWKENSPV
jgi:molybdopterin synthase catalytic subunit